MENETNQSTNTFGVGDRARVKYSVKNITLRGEEGFVASAVSSSGHVHVELHKGTTVFLAPKDLEKVVGPVLIKGTQGQLDGFLKDWKEAGHDHDGDGHRKGLYLCFPPGHVPYIHRGIGGDFHAEKPAVPILPFWQALLDRANEHRKKSCTVVGVVGSKQWAVEVRLDAKTVQTTHSKPMPLSAMQAIVAGMRMQAQYLRGSQGLLSSWEDVLDFATKALEENEAL